MSTSSVLLDGLLDLIWPERCTLCGAGAEARRLVRPGRSVAGLRRRDRPHLCRFCLADLRGTPYVTQVALPAGERLPAAAGLATCDKLVELVGAWKYQGVRGLAWPLAALTLPALDRLLATTDADLALVPVPLHHGRHRERGFNQAEMLARLLGRERDLPIRTDLVRRQRSTAQQAQIDDDACRAANVSAAFDAGAVANGPHEHLVVIDDLITSGATIAACATALRRAGHVVVWCLSIGLARR